MRVRGRQRPDILGLSYTTLTLLLEYEDTVERGGGREAT